ncbi:fido domain-containing protein [Triangularia verruculosa]|uniref:Fido domain-containing protein n=1 Tax=Triangularia verruculosa TaxID=2587418 RepID=A0AAN6XCD1_9PEZI|nr:fido domain-containing protein [Triangularia verruculosa]
MSTTQDSESSWISRLNGVIPSPRHLSHQPSPSSLESSITASIYGSNRIETAGTTFSITAELCRHVFRRSNPAMTSVDTPAEFPTHSHRAVVDDLALTGRKPADLTRAYKEVTQHAQAFMYLTKHIILCNQPWSEELILETHRLLCSQLSQTITESDEIGAGQYRTHEVAVKYDLKDGGRPKTTLCMRAKVVPRYMKELVDMLNQDGARAYSEPYEHATRYHHRFVFIHPFGDGNGRMGRLVLNVLLLKYAGHVVIYAIEKAAQKEYIDMVSRASKIFHEEDMEVELEDQTWHEEFAGRLKQKFDRR